MSDPAIPARSAARPRYVVIDMARGLAIIAMVAFHLGWDLWYFGFMPTDVTADPFWVSFQRLVLGSFMALVGISLVLAHGNGIRWRPFWRRFAIIAGAALLVTIATLFLFPETFVFFGVLHAIALFSLLGLAFLRLPPLLNAALGALILILPVYLSDPVFTEKPLAWIGFWPVSPPTNDLVPIFPWFGVVLIAMAVTRLVLGSSLAPRLAAIEPRGIVTRALVFLGRWSLLIYLLHQPILIGIIYPLAMNRPAVVAEDPVTGFIRSCEQSCQQVGSDPAYCAAYCQCAVEKAAGDETLDLLSSPMDTPQRQSAVSAIIGACTPPPGFVPQP